MFNVHNFFLVLVFVLHVFLMPFQKPCVFPGQNPHGTNAILDCKHIPAANLKVAQSEHGIRDVFVYLCFLLPWLFKYVRNV